MKYKKRTPGHKKLLNVFNSFLDIILTDKTIESKNQKNENEKVEIRKDENEDKDYENEYGNEDYENKNE